MGYLPCRQRNELLITGSFPKNYVYATWQVSVGELGLHEPRPTDEMAGPLVQRPLDCELRFDWLNGRLPLKPCAGMRFVDIFYTTLLVLCVSSVPLW